MRAIASILAVTVGVSIIGLGPFAFSQTATLHYNGAYHHIGGDRTTQHLRFYRDGFVVSAATPKALTPVWLQRDFPGLPTGRYSIRGNRIEITLNTNLPDALPDSLRGSIPRRHHYAGVIRSGYLELRRDGLAESKRYDFVKILSFK